MKIRSDFVSNSSSSSFIISAIYNIDEMEFIIDKHLTPEDTNKVPPEIIRKISKTNRNTVSIGFDNNTLLFLGDYELIIDNEKNSVSELIVKKNGLADYLHNHKEWFFVPKNHKDDEPVFKCTPEQAKEQFIEELNKSIKDILTAKYSAYDAFIENECAEITQSTIDITQYMIDYGLDIKIDTNLFNTIKKAISENKHVYYITVNDDGLGINYGSVFISRSLYDITSYSENISKINGIDVLYEIEN